jgi:hypothetical protein
LLLFGVAFVVVVHLQHLNHVATPVAWTCFLN